MVLNPTCRLSKPSQSKSASSKPPYDGGSCFCAKRSLRPGVQIKLDRDRQYEKYVIFAVGISIGLCITQDNRLQVSLKDYCLRMLEIRKECAFFSVRPCRFDIITSSLMFRLRGPSPKTKAATGPIPSVLVFLIIVCNVSGPESVLLRYRDLGILCKMLNIRGQ